MKAESSTSLSSHILGNRFSHKSIIIKSRTKFWPLFWKPWFWACQDSRISSAFILKLCHWLQMGQIPLLSSCWHHWQVCMLIKTGSMSNPVEDQVQITICCVSLCPLMETHYSCGKIPFLIWDMKVCQDIRGVLHKTNNGMKGEKNWIVEKMTMK